MTLPESAGWPVQRQILDALPALVLCERAGIIVFANAEAQQLIGVSGDWVPLPLNEVLCEPLEAEAPPTPLLGTAAAQPFRATLRSQAGQLHALAGSCRRLCSEPSETIIVAHPADRLHPPATRLLEDVLASLPEALAIEADGHLLYANPGFFAMFGYTPEEARGASLLRLIVPETRLNEHTTLLKGVDEKGRVQVDTVRATKPGELIDVSLHIAPLTVEAARAGYVYSFREIGENKAAEAKLQHDAMHDVLTGLPNRALFLDRLNLALHRRGRRPDLGCGVLYLDLDRFKEVNDGLGHATGDLLLRTVSERLTAVLRPQDSAARLGGDEFAVLVENIVSVGDLEIVAGRVLRALQQPFNAYGHIVDAGVSIGAALAGPDHHTADQLMRDADLAMYRAKRSGGLRFEIFDKHLQVRATLQQERERELRTILDQRLFEYAYQPVFQLGNGALEGFEATLSWRLQDGSAGDIRELLAVAEESGLSINLGREILEAVFAQRRLWSAALPPNPLFFAVKVTPRQFYHREFVAHVRQAISATEVEPSRVVLLIPEGALNQNSDAAIAILQRLADCRLRVALDEFGASLAPLHHLVRLPFDMLKLDPKLTAAALAGGRQQAVLESLLHLTSTLGIKAIADGITSREQLQALYRMGCVAGLGPALCLPLEAGRALALAQSRLGSLPAPQ